MDRFRVTILLLLFILVAGSIAFKEIPRETEPTIEIPMAVVTTVWPGASPLDMEKLVTNKIEQEIKGLDNLEEYTSTSRSGISIITVEFDVDSDREANLQKLRDKISDVETDLPDSLPDNPRIQEVSVSDTPVVKMVLSGDFAWSELKTFAEILEDEFEGITKVKEVNVIGAPNDEFHVILDPLKLEIQHLDVSSVLQSIRANHRDMPLGVLNVDGETIEVTVRSEFKTATQLMELPIKADGNTIVKIGDIGEVRREFEKFEVETYFSEKDKAYPAVEIDVIKAAASGNVIKMVDSVYGKLEELKDRGVIPRSLRASVTFDRAKEIQKDLDTLMNSGGQTLVLIAIVMLVFVGWRESVLAALVIPLSMLIAIMVLHSMGRTFNGVSLFALVLGIGLLVDNAIIIVEGINDAIHEKKLSPREAALHTLQTFRWPIISGTLTTVFAFLPMLFFITGISGQYISVIPITVTAVLVAALFVALLMLPAVSVRFFEWIPAKGHKEYPTLRKIQAWYDRTMTGILARKWKVFGVLGASFVIFLLSFGLVLTKQVPVEVFPSTDFTFFTAEFEFPKGTNLSETRKLIDPLSQELQKFFEPHSLKEDGEKEVWLKNFVFTAGISQDTNENNIAEESILGLTINLTDEDLRNAKSYEIMPIMEKELKKIIPAHVETTFSEMKAGPPTGAALEVRIEGDDINHIKVLSDNLQEDIEKMPGTLNVRDTSAERTTQVTWNFDREKMTRLGLTPSQILEILRSAVNGSTAIKITEGDDEIDVDVRMDWTGDRKWRDPESLDYLNRISIKTPSGKFVTLEQVATPKIAAEFSEVKHRDGMRIISVKADMEKGLPVSTIEKDIKQAIKKLERLPGERVEIGGDSEEGNKLMGQSLKAMAFALLLILVILVAQYNSFYQSFVTLVLIPLSLTGVFIGFWLSGRTISFPTMIGIVSLAGIIVNDAIVLIDQINHNLKQGLPWLRANIEAAKTRLQPIFLTSVTTVVGMIPLSLSDEMWGGLGFAIVYGMVLSTILTLLLIPCFLTAGKITSRSLRNGCRKMKCFFVQNEE